MPNIARLKTLLEYVEKLDPERIYMPCYFAGTGSPIEPDCGTAACLAGWATAAFPNELYRCRDGSRIARYNTRDDVDLTYTVHVLEAFFDLTAAEREAIFAGSIPSNIAVENLRKHIREWSRKRLAPRLELATV